MSLYALYGTGYNQLARMATAATPEAADALFPIANLYDGKPWQPFRFGAAGTSGYVDFDLNQVVNGGFATALSGGLPGSGWGKSAGATLVIIGGPALEVQGSGGEYCYFDFSVAPGEVLTITGNAASCVSGPTAGIEVRNLTTGSYLASTEVWQASPVVWQVGTGSQTGTFTVESYSACGYQDRVTLRILLYAGDGLASSHNTYSSLFVYPRINFAGVFGHNIQPNTAPVEIRSGTGSPAATTRATMTLAQPTMFSTFASVDERYWRLFFTNDPLSSATWLGEVVLGQYQTLTRRQNFGQDLTLKYAQDRSDSGDMGIYAAYVRQTPGRRTVGLRFRYNDDTDYEQAREIVERSQGGAHPMILVIESGDETQAMLGRIEPEWTHQRITNTMRDADWKFTELPFPTVLP